MELKITLRRMVGPCKQVGTSQEGSGYGIRGRGVKVNIQHNTQKIHCGSVSIMSDR